MNNEFLQKLKQSFITYLNTDPRSNEKLKILHGFVSQQLRTKLGSKYEVYSLGIGTGKEKSIMGRYMDKNVDITIEKEGKPIAGISVKFVMSNYSQNSNNYFENMLGETANIRTNNIPYFQIFAIPKTIPYFNKEKVITKWENISEHNLDKYIRLSKDNIDLYFHTPNKTLISIIELSPFDTSKIKNASDFYNYFNLGNFNVSFSNTHFNFGNGIVYNDFLLFIDKVYHTIMSI